MTNEVTPEPRKTKRDELVQTIADTNNYLSMEMAERLADRIIATGWQWHPPKLEEFDLDFNEVALPYPTAYALRTPDQEIDILDRIISGLPARVLTPANPDGVHIYDVVSLHPVELTNWTRIPEYDNYEINGLGIIRNRWTRRVLDVTENGGEEYVDMHDKDGFEHTINVRYVREKVFGK